MIEKSISQYVSRQFPAFYKEEGETFIAFVKAYYEWLESYDVRTIFLESSVNKFRVGDYIVQNDPLSPSRVCEVGSDYIRVSGSYVDWVEGGYLWRLDSSNLKPSGTVTITTLNNDHIIGTNTAFKTEAADGCLLLIAGLDAIEIEYVASDGVVKAYYDVLRGLVAVDQPYKLFITSNKSKIKRVDDTPNPVSLGRALPDYRDVDNTLDLFLEHFNKKYLYGIPKETLGDRRLLLKNIISFYRSKGTLASFEFLFRLLYNESVEMYIPADDLFRTSNSEWVRPYYIEVSDSPYLAQLVGKRIYSASENGSAIVEDFSRLYAKNRMVNVLLLSHIEGDFNYNEFIHCDGITIDSQKLPKVLGSLTSMTIESGGYGYSTGEYLRVVGNGEGGKVRVASTKAQSGKVKFTLVDGGSGYSLDYSQVAVSSVYKVSLPGTAPGSPLPNIASGDRVYQNNGTSNTFVGDVISYNIPDAQASIKKISGAPTVSTPLLFRDKSQSLAVSGFSGGGSGATFQVGGLADPKVMSVNEDIINNGLSTVMDSAGYKLTIANASGAFTVGEQVSSVATTIVVEADYGLGAQRYVVGEQVNFNGKTAFVCRVDGKFVILKNFGLNIPAVGNVLFGLSSGLATSILWVSSPRSSQGVATITAINGSVLTVGSPTADGYYVSNLTINGIGSGYANGDIITFKGPASTVAAYGKVTTNKLGSVVDYTLVSKGKYTASTLPTVDVVSSTGLGLGAVLIPTMKQNAGSFLTDVNVLGLTSGKTGVISVAERQTDWTNFTKAKVSPNLYYNLDDTLDSMFTVTDVTYGKITYLKNINPGSGYSVDPVITVTDSKIFPLQIVDIDVGGTYMGGNARVIGKAGTLSGIIDTVEVVNSGYAYGHLERLSLVSDTNPTAAYSAGIISRGGRGEGYWKDNEGFLSSNKYIIDSNYYQEYSYELRSKVTLEKYKEVMLKIAHPAGFAMFGSFLHRDTRLEAANMPVASYLNQTTD